LYRSSGELGAAGVMLRFNNNPVRRSDEVGVVAVGVVLGCEISCRFGCVADGHQVTGWEDGETTGEGDDRKSVVSESTSAK
jgi:hypothetical protein